MKMLPPFENSRVSPAHSSEPEPSRIRSDTKDFSSAVPLKEPLISRTLSVKNGQATRLVTLPSFFGVQGFLYTSVCVTFTASST